MQYFSIFLGGCRKRQPSKFFGTPKWHMKRSEAKPRFRGLFTMRGWDCPSGWNREALQLKPAIIFVKPIVSCQIWLTLIEWIDGAPFNGATLVMETPSFAGHRPIENEDFRVSLPEKNTWWGSVALGSFDGSHHLDPVPCSGQARKLCSTILRPGQWSCKDSRSSNRGIGAKEFGFKNHICVWGHLSESICLFFLPVSLTKRDRYPGFFLNIRAKMIQQELCGTTRMSFVDRPLVHWFEEFINCRGGLLISCWICHKTRTTSIGFGSIRPWGCLDLGPGLIRGRKAKTLVEPSWRFIYVYITH